MSGSVGLGDLPVWNAVRDNGRVPRMPRDEYEASAETVDLRLSGRQRQEERDGRMRQGNERVVEVERRGGLVLGVHGHGEGGDLGTGGAHQGVGE